MRISFEQKKPWKGIFKIFFFQFFLFSDTSFFEYIMFSIIINVISESFIHLVITILDKKKQTWQFEKKIQSILKITLLDVDYKSLRKLYVFQSFMVYNIFNIKLYSYFLLSFCFKALNSKTNVFWNSHFSTFFFFLTSPTEFFIVTTNTHVSTWENTF